LSDKFKFNPFTGKLDLVEHIPELTSDPVSPRTEDAWVLQEGSGSTGGGTIIAPLGLGFIALTTGSAGALTYKFSYRTKADTTGRVALS